MIIPAYTTGRCANGAQRDHGRLYHAISDYQVGHLSAAICGQSPGRLSQGWVAAQSNQAVTCQRCRKRILTPRKPGHVLFATRHWR